MPGVSGEVSAAVRDLASRNMTASEGLGIFRDTMGGAVANNTWFDEWFRQTQNFVAELGWTGADLRRIPSPEMMGTWETGNPGLYAYSVRIPTFDPNTGLQVDRYTDLLYDRAVSPSKAMNDALSQMAEFFDDPNYPKIAGVPEFKGVYQTV